jgi:hypothetical protein
MDATNFFSLPTIKTTMSLFDLTNLNKILTNHNDKTVKDYFYRHKTSGANMFRCSCCDFETKLFRDEEMKEHTTLIKQKHNIKTHMLSYDHRFNEYYGKGLIPDIPDFDGDLINNIFAFFKDHITSVADDDGLFWCDLCDVSFKTRTQLYTHLVKTNKKHLVRQVEKEYNAPFKVVVSQNTYEITFLNDKPIISPESRAVMEKYKNSDSYYCKNCYFTPVDDDDFYKHLTSKTHRRNKIRDDFRDIYTINEEHGDYCKKCECDVIDILTHHTSH